MIMLGFAAGEAGDLSQWQRPDASGRWLGPGPAAVISPAPVAGR